MASEIFTVPDERVMEVVAVFRAGLITAEGVSEETRRNITRWCDDQQDYVERMDQLTYLRKTQ